MGDQKSSTHKHRNAEKSPTKSSDEDLMSFNNCGRHADTHQKRSTSSECSRAARELSMSFLTEMKKTPGCSTSLGKLEFGRNHTVLVNVDAYNSKKALIPQTGRDLWSSDYVRMPCSDSSHYTKGTFIPGEESRWKAIKKSLEKLPQKPSVQDVEKAILKYNPKYKNDWNFDALHSFFEHFPKQYRETHSRTLYKIAELALQLPKLCPKAIPLLKQGRDHAITLSQMQIACLLANAFYCTFPFRNSTNPRAEYANYPDINFHRLFGQWSERKLEKFKTIFHYFKTVTDKEPHGLVTFERRHLTKPYSWDCANEKLTDLHVTAEGNIETEGKEMLQVDFACKLVGGGVLGSGLVQEEIRFLINTELIVSRLFTEKLGDQDCLRIIGTQRYSIYSGYSDSYKWDGPFEDLTPRDEWHRRITEIVAIDALEFKHYNEQFNIGKVNRELNKAFCGFQGDRRTDPSLQSAVATGNWGCGAFKGDAKLKALIQMMAASAARRNLVYFTFGDQDLRGKLENIHSFLREQNVTMARLYSVLEMYCRKPGHSREPNDLYTFISNSILDTKSKH
ncbi:PARG glycohydrolase, partial [Amia calva]|nr:PARG glycohydrolase [Amia calva]